MLVVEVGKGGIESALKKLKRKWDKTKMIKEVRSLGLNIELVEE